MGKQNKIACSCNNIKRVRQSQTNISLRWTYNSYSRRSIHPSSLCPRSHIALPKNIRSFEPNWTVFCLFGMSKQKGMFVLRREVRVWTKRWRSGSGERGKWSRCWPGKGNLLSWNKLFDKQVGWCSSSLPFKIRTIDTRKRAYCHTCGLFILTNNADHESHEIQAGVSNDYLLKPTMLLKPLSNDQREAQYFFTESALKCFASLFQQMRLK